MGSISPADRKIRISEAGGVAEGATEEKHALNGEAASPAMHTEKGGVVKNSCARGDGCIGRLRMVDISLRSAMVAFMVVSLSAMFTSTQHSEVVIFGLTIPLSMRWNRSQPFQFLVVVEIIVCAYSLIQFVHGSVVSATKAVPTRRRMMIQLAADQVCTYLVLAAAAAAAGASRTNKSAFRSLGVQNIHVPGVCTILNKFCNRATIAIIFTLCAAGASAINAALDVYLLAMTY